MRIKTRCLFLVDSNIRMMIVICVLLLTFVFQQGLVVGRIVQCTSWGDPHVIPFPANETSYPREVWCQKSGLMWLVKNKYILSTVTVGSRPYYAYDFQFVFRDDNGLVICVVDGKQVVRGWVPDCSAYGVNVILENRGVTIKYPKVDFLATIIFSQWGPIDSIKVWLDSCLAKVSDGICNTGCSDIAKDCQTSVPTTTIATTTPKPTPEEQKVQVNADQICEIFIQQALATLNFQNDDQRISLRTEIINSKTACITDLTLTGDLKAAVASILNLALYKFTWNITSYTSLSFNFSTIINIAININIQIINMAILTINETIIYRTPTVNFEQIHLGFDSPGNDIEVLSNISTRRQCVEICMNTSKCVAVAYQLSNGICFIKSCVIRLTAKVGTDVVHLAVGKQGQPLSGFDAPGNNLRNLTNNNLTISACIEECKKNTGCVGISFRYADRMCFMKYFMSQLVQTPGVDTVYIAEPHTCNPPCQNGGTCVGNNTCACSSGYTGSICTVQSVGLCTDAQIRNSTPVLSITFGAGTARYSNSTAAKFDFTTTYQQKFSDPVDDGMFGLVNAVPTNRPAWHGGSRDHTGNTGGYMLFVNANLQAGRFYNGTVKNLTVGVQYQFSVWAANAVKSGNNLLAPQVLFEVRSLTAGNALLAQLNSGSIPEYSNMTWKQYGLSFVAPTTSVVLLMISNAPGGNGNDLVLDDIELRRCSKCSPFWRMPSSQQTTYFTYVNANTHISNDSSRSVCAWFRVSTFNIDNIIVDIGSSNTECNTHFTLIVSNSTHIRVSGMCDIFNDGPIFIGPDTLYDNAFHQICITYNSMNARLCTYRDFQPAICTTRNSRAYNTSLGDVRIGWWPAENHQFVGLGGGLIQSVALFENEIFEDCIADEMNRMVKDTTISPMFSTNEITFQSTSVSSRTTTLSTSESVQIPIVETNTYIRFTLSLSIDNRYLTQFQQLENDLRFIFISALHIYSNQIKIHMIMPSKRTLANITVQVFLFDSVIESADSVLQRIYQQLTNTSSAFHHHNLTSQLTAQSISDVQRIYICDEGSEQETPCTPTPTPITTTTTTTTTATTSENSLRRILLAGIIPSICIVVVFGVIIISIAKYRRRYERFL